MNLKRTKLDVPVESSDDVGPCGLRRPVLCNWCLVRDTRQETRLLTTSHAPEIRGSTDDERRTGTVYVRRKKVAGGDRLKTDATSAHCSAAAAAASLRSLLLSAINLSVRCRIFSRVIAKTVHGVAPCGG